MSWILLLLWVMILVAAAFYFENRARKRQQGSYARTRPNLSRARFIDDLATRGVSQLVATEVWQELLPSCGKDMILNPADPIFGFLVEEGEDMEDIIENLYARLNLPPPERYDPEITPHLEAIGDLAVFLESRVKQRAISS